MIITAWFVLHFVISFIAPKIIPYYGLFSFPDQLEKYNLSHFISAFANFDGAQYLKIVNEGYSEWRHAFFPLYPILTKILGMLTFGNHLVAGLIVSSAGLVTGLCFFQKYLSRIGVEKKNIWWIGIFVLAFPTAFFFQGLYTESLFFLFAVLTFYSLKRKKYLMVGIFAFLASLTRFIGVFLFVPIMLSWFLDRNEGRRSVWGLISAVFPILGLATYSFYLFKFTGNPLAFFSDQPAFGAGRSTALVLFPQVYFRYLKIFLTANHDLRYFIAMFEAIVFSLVLIVLFFDFKNNWKNKDRVVLWTFSIINLIVPTATGTFLSIPRFTLLSLSFFVFLGELKNIALKFFLSLFFLVLQIVLLVLFIQGYFVA